MASVVPFPNEPMERTNARTFILPDDNAAIDFAHALRRLEQIIRDKHRDPAPVIDLDAYRAMHAWAPPSS